MENTSQKKVGQQLINRSVIEIPIDDNLISLRGLSPKRLRFEVEYGLERGTTANSFLFKADNKYQQTKSKKTAILIHPPGATFQEFFIPSLLEFVSPQTTNLLVVVGHVNPNRLVVLRSLAKKFSSLKLITSNAGAKLLRDLWFQEKPSKDQHNKEKTNEIPSIPEIKVIRKEEEIEINQNYRLTLIPAPTARWPGGLIAFENSLGLLMSDKFFGAHLCTTDWAEANALQTEEERRHYFDCLMVPMANQVDALVDKLEELDIKTIAPGHGPAIEGSWRSLINDYRRWSEQQKKSSLKVALLFASAYGNTAAIADALATGISRTGICIESLNCEFTSTNELIEAIKTADGYLIGSPTLGGHAPTPIVSALGTLLAEGDRQKPVGIFGSYGWSGEALDLLESKLRDGGFIFSFDPIKIKFSPDVSTLQTLEQTGTSFGRKLIKAQTIQQRRTQGGVGVTRSDPALIALGRIIGSLCILTTYKGEENEMRSGAMVASWISQASFSPPGITIAIAKDRAVEALLHCGDSFALNILAAGRENKLMKQFLKPFDPGADRFESLDLTLSPAGHPLFLESLAWVEGTVKQRMECGDHWLIYAEINNGKVLDQQGITAVHHRKSGANY